MGFLSVANVVFLSWGGKAGKKFNGKNLADEQISSNQFRLISFFSFHAENSSCVFAACITVRGIVNCE